MNRVIDAIPGMSDEDLMTTWQNSLRLLSRSDNRPAETVRDAVEAEWDKRAEGTQTGTDKSGPPKIGMLATLGSHVGETHSIGPATRR